MRQIDWDTKLSEEDIAWLRQTGIPGMEDRIEKHQESYGAEVPEEVVKDGGTVLQSVLDPNASASSPTGVESIIKKIDPTQADSQNDEELDDYDTWTKTDLEREVTARNKIAEDSDGDVSGVEVVGTGSSGSIKKEDLIKGLRLWDQENPDALKD